MTFALTIQQRELVRLLRYASNVIAPRNIIPVLACTRLTLRANSLSVEATDTDRWFAASIPVEGQAEMNRVVVPLTELREIVSAMPTDQEVSFSEKGKRLTISSGRSRYVLPLFDIGEWPECTAERDVATFILQAGNLRNAIDTVLPNISADEQRHYLKGIQFLLRDDHLRLAATDGHRLTHLRLPFDETQGKFVSAIVPGETAATYSKLLRDLPSDQPVVLGLRDGATFIEIKLGSADVALFSRTVDGTYPDTDRMLPTEKMSRATLPVTALEDALTRIAIIAENLKAMKGKKVSFVLGNGALAIQSHNVAGSSEGSEHLEVEFTDPREIGFNLDYLRAILRQFDGEIDMRYSDSVKPIVFVPTGVQIADAAKLTIVMPMRG